MISLRSSNANTDPRRHSKSPLAHSHLQVVIDDLLASYELHHSFQNDGERSVEAVYTFPIPLDAAFMGMEAVLAGERRIAEVLPARQASRQYDDAVADGDSAVLLERVEPGLLCVSLGNLKPGEEGEITLRFVAALSVADGRARFSLPLVQRPRYGRSKLPEMVTPQTDFAVEHALQAQIVVRGLLAGCAVQCATQDAQFQVIAGELRATLAEAMLDRDLVMIFNLPEQGLSRSRWVVDGDQSIGVVSFVPPLPPTSNLSQAVELCLVLDCSGSMNGDAIAQTRQALMSIAQSLNDADHLQVLRFGSSVVPVFQRPLKVSARVKQSLFEWVSTVQADLGGTNMQAALDQAIDALSAARGTERLPVIILVTDGAVAPLAVEAAQERATLLGIRIFVVAVGSSAGVDVLGPLASATQATLERAVPAEPIADAVMRQFRRARQRHPLNMQIQWGSDGEGPPLGIVYAGDAVTALARFPDQKRRTVRVQTSSTDASLSFNLDHLVVSPEWRTWSGQQCHLHATGNAKADLALRYGLITEETSAVLVKVRVEGDKVVGLPAIIPIAHMRPHGMGIAMSLSMARPSPLARQVPAADLSFGGEYCRSPIDRQVPAASHSMCEDFDSSIAMYCSAPDFAELCIQPDPSNFVDAMDQEQIQRAELVLLVVLPELLAQPVASAQLMDQLLALTPSADRSVVEQYLSNRHLSLGNQQDVLALLLELRERREKIMCTDG